jgi:hypothetical protein
LLIAAGLVLVAMITAAAVALANSDGGGGQKPTGSGATTGVVETTPAVEETEPETPADEQCTDEIKSNPRWVCLTSATLSGGKLVIEYDADWAGGQPNIRGGYHVHFWASDGENPPETTKGSQFPDSDGNWYIDDQEPSVTTEGTSNYAKIIRPNGKPRAPKVCARIANGQHQLVRDDSGENTYHTGNCVPITEP